MALHWYLIAAQTRYSEAFCESDSYENLKEPQAIKVET